MRRNRIALLLSSLMALASQQAPATTTYVSETNHSGANILDSAAGAFGYAAIAEYGDAYASSSIQGHFKAFGVESYAEYDLMYRVPSSTVTIEYSMIVQGSAINENVGYYTDTSAYVRILAGSEYHVFNSAQYGYAAFSDSLRIYDYTTDSWPEETVAKLNVTETITDWDTRFPLAVRLISQTRVAEFNYVSNNSREEGSFVSVAAFVDPIIRDANGNVIEPIILPAGQRIEDGGGSFDNPFAPPLPEPSTTLLVGLGLFGFLGPFGWGRRRADRGEFPFSINAPQRAGRPE